MVIEGESESEFIWFCLVKVLISGIGVSPVCKLKKHFAVKLLGGRKKKKNVSNYLQ